MYFVPALRTRSHALFVFVFVLGVVVLAPGVVAEGVVNGNTAAVNGLPFLLDPNAVPPVMAAGPHFNPNNNGIQDFGEVAVDCGGAGAAFCPVSATAPLQFNFNTPVNLQLTHNGVTLRAIRQTGKIHGRPFDIVFPDPVANPGLPMAGTGIVFYYPTRRPFTHHAAGPLLSAAVLHGFIFKGAAVGTVSDLVSLHPYVEAVQNGHRLANLMRTQMAMTRVVVSGSSFGGGAGLAHVLLRPQDFDGFFLPAVVNLANSFGQWHAMFRNLDGAQGRTFQIYGLDDVDSDQAMTLYNQFGQTPWIHDVFTTDGLKRLQIPGILLFGDIDAQMPQFDDIAVIKQRLASLGITYVEVIEHKDSGHSGPCGPPIQGLEDKLVGLMNSFTGPAFAPPPAPYLGPSQGRFDPLLFANRTPGPSAAWVGGPQKLVTQWQNNLPAGIGRHLKSYAKRTEGATDALVFGDRFGIVRKVRFVPSGASFQVVEDWAQFVGMEIGTIIIDDIDSNGSDEVVLACMRGMFVLDAATGIIQQSAQNLPHAKTVAVGEAVASNPGKEIVYGAGISLVVMGAAGNRLHTQDIGVVNRILFDTTPAGDPRILISSPRGHVFRLLFQPNGQDLQMLCDAASTYLGMSPYDMTFVQMPGGGRVLVTVGQGFPGSTFVVEMMPDLTITRTWTAGSLVGYDVDDAGNGHILTAEGSSVFEYDLTLATPIPVQRKSKSRHILQGGFTAPSQLVMFRNDEGLEILDTTSSPTYSTVFHWKHRAINTAFNVFPTAGQTEVSVLTAPRDVGITGQDWQVDVFDGDTGAPITQFAKSYLTTPHTEPPKVMTRTMSALIPDSYTTFRHAGDRLFDPATGTFGFAATDVGFTSVFSNINQYWSWGLDCSPMCQRQGWLKETGGTSAPSCGNPPGVPLIVGRFGPEKVHFDTVDYYATAAVRQGLVPNGDDAVVVTAPNGKARLWSLLGNQTRTDLGFLTMGLDTLTGPAGVTDLIAIGSMFPDGSGDTLHVMDASLSTLTATNAGIVCGLHFSSLDLDGVATTDEIIVGCANGELAVYVYDQIANTLTEQWRENVGVLMVGARNGIAVFQGQQGENLVAFSVDGGVIVKEIVSL